MKHCKELSCKVAQHLLCATTKKRFFSNIALRAGERDRLVGLRIGKVPLVLRPGIRKGDAEEIFGTRQTSLCPRLHGWPGNRLG